MVTKLGQNGIKHPDCATRVWWGYKARARAKTIINTVICLFYAFQGFFSIGCKLRASVNLIVPEEYLLCISIYVDRIVILNEPNIRIEITTIFSLFWHQNSKHQ